MQTNTYISSSVQLGAGLAMVEDKNFASNSVTFSGLSGNYVYKVFLAGSSGIGDMVIEINGDTTATHYYNQRTLSDGVNVTTERANTNSIGPMPVNGNHYWELTIGNDVYSNNWAYISLQGGIAADIINRVTAGSGLAAAITSIKFVSNVAFSGRAILYRLGEK